MKLVGEPKLKKSFLLNKKLIQDITNYIKPYQTEEIPLHSKYRIYEGLIKSSNIIIFTSGIVVYETSKTIEDLLIIFFNKYQLNPPIIEAYKEKSSNAVNNSIQNDKPGLDYSLKSIWLSEKQREKLLTDIRNQSNIHILDIKNPNELYRFQIGNAILVLNKNGTVYSIGGFEGYTDLVGKVIKSRLNYPTYDWIIGIDIAGRRSKIGPAVISCIAAKQSDLINWQLAGIKHASIGRTPSVFKMSKIISNSNEFLTHLLIYPKKFNTITKQSWEEDEEQIEKLICKGYLKLIKNLLIKLNKSAKNSYQILIIIERQIWEKTNKQLISLLPKTYTIKFIDPDVKNEYITAPLSVIAQAEIEKWKSQKEQILQMKILPQNIESILQTDLATEIVKLRYLKYQK